MRTYRCPLSGPYQHSLTVSWKEGIAAMIMFGIVEYYTTPFALFLGATPQQIGIMVAVSNFCGALYQLFSSYVVNRIGSRLRSLVMTVFVQAVLYIIMAGFAWAQGAHRVEWFIACVVLQKVVGNIIATIWSSLVSEYLEPKDRGHYFGWRAQVIGVAGVLAMAGSGLLLFVFKKMQLLSLGLFLLFALAGCARVVSAYLMSFMQEVPLTHTEVSVPDVRVWLSWLRSNNVVRFIAYAASLLFATYIAGPYFSVYMLKELHFSYLAYMVVTISSVTAGIVAYPVWGRRADIVGNVAIMRATSLLIPLIPVFWLVTKNVYVLVTLEWFSGFVWAGFNLCSLNFLYDAVPPDKRLRWLSYYTFMNGMAFVGGSLVGCALIHYAPPFNGSVFYSVFLVSALLRLASHLICSGKVHEVRHNIRRAARLDILLSAIGLRSLKGRLQRPVRSQNATVPA